MWNMIFDCMEVWVSRPAFFLQDVIFWEKAVSKLKTAA